mgnify:CR=1 FL=1
MSKLRMMLALLFSAMIMTTPAYAWWNKDWKYRKVVTVDTSPSGLNVSGQIGRTVMLVKLTSGNFTFTDAMQNGADIRLVDSDDERRGVRARERVLVGRVTADREEDDLVVGLAPRVGELPLHVARLAGAQADPGAVRAVAEAGGGLAHPALGLLADVGRILQRAGDGGHGKAGCGGDGLQGGPLGFRIRGWQQGRVSRSRHHAPPFLPDAARTGWKSRQVIRLIALPLQSQKQGEDGGLQVPVRHAFLKGLGTAASLCSGPAHHAELRGIVPR